MGRHKKSSCELVDAFAILTRQGVVLLSDDALITDAEDAYLYGLNKKMIERAKKRKECNKQ